VTAETRYDEGEAFARQQRWKQAEAAYAEATKLRADLPEAWNGLGHARKMQREFPEALAAYQQALRLRPDFPQALEYLGETYVAMGRMDDARATLAKLRPLDAALADQLAHAIDGGKTAAAAW
jgi:cytochrome c-type biogenesis protein CcmH/NrfG